MQIFSKCIHSYISSVATDFSGRKSNSQCIGVALPLMHCKEVFNYDIPNVFSTIVK